GERVDNHLAVPEALEPRAGGVREAAVGADVDEQAPGRGRAGGADGQAGAAVVRQQAARGRDDELCVLVGRVEVRDGDRGGRGGRGRDRERLADLRGRLRVRGDGGRGPRGGRDVRGEPELALGAAGERVGRGVRRPGDGGAAGGVRGGPASRGG